DKEIFMDLDFDGTFDMVVFLTSFPNSTTTSHTNVYWTELVDLTGVYGPGGRAYFWDYGTNAIDPATGLPTNQDTNSFNNSVVHVPVDAIVGSGFSSFQYQVVTFDRNGNEVDETPVLFFDAAAPGIDTTPAGQFEP